MPIAQSRKKNSIKNNIKNNTINRDSRNSMRSTKKILNGGGLFKNLKGYFKKPTIKNQPLPPLPPPTLDTNNGGETYDNFDNNKNNNRNRLHQRRQQEETLEARRQQEKTLEARKTQELKTLEARRQQELNNLTKLTQQRKNNIRKSKNYSVIKKMFKKTQAFNKINDNEKKEKTKIDILFDSRINELTRSYNIMRNTASMAESKRTQSQHSPLYLNLNNSSTGTSTSTNNLYPNTRSKNTHTFEVPQFLNKHKHANIIQISKTHFNEAQKARKDAGVVNRNSFHMTEPPVHATADKDPDPLYENNLMIQNQLQKAQLAQKAQEAQLAQLAQEAQKAQ